MSFNQLIQHSKEVDEIALSCSIGPDQYIDISQLEIKVFDGLKALYLYASDLSHLLTYHFYE